MSLLGLTFAITWPQRSAAVKEYHLVAAQVHGNVRRFASTQVRVKALQLLISPSAPLKTCTAAGAALL